ncbi:hypothetical protein [Streptomyces tropicalis]|uniref:Uncharacterized protein n=1 Tax=Streptomyces tropicalis TaxID=3034234 RepID=A0ABT6ACW8_9ACTN|nr:hypothetical protein [Streptomyces tropicalis]MDF3302486.1 hypothetical protein [Streptomyces tropicalis]
MTGPHRHTIDVPADHHQYWLLATRPGDEEPPYPAEPKTGDVGLLDVSRKGRAGHVHTHTPYGDIHLALEFHDHAPALQTDGWHTVTEASMRLADEILLTNPADAEHTVPVPSTAGEWSWWRVRVHARTQAAGEGLHPPGVHEEQEHHLIQLWPAPKGPATDIIDRGPVDVLMTDADESVAGSCSIAFKEPSHSLTFAVGDRPRAFDAGPADTLALADDGRSARIPTTGWDDKTLFGAAVSFTRPLPTTAAQWQIDHAFTLHGPGTTMWITPDEDLEYADSVPLPMTVPERGWHIIVYTRGRTDAGDGEYYVTVWPES